MFPISNATLSVAKNVWSDKINIADPLQEMPRVTITHTSAYHLPQQSPICLGPASEAPVKYKVHVSDKKWSVDVLKSNN